jgi:hypothetical protein
LKINVDTNLEQEKIEQIWQMLNQFQDVFSGHKGEMG